MSIRLVIGLATLMWVVGSTAAADDAEPAEAQEASATKPQVRTEGALVYVDPVPPGFAKGGNGYVRGIQLMLAQAGHPVPYERLMGLSGTAFMLQAETHHRWEGTLDAGWWPVDPWGLGLRHDFLARAIGVELIEAGAFYDASRWGPAGQDPKAHYTQHIAPLVVKTIGAGRTPLATWCATKHEWGYLITGYDDAADQPPVLGRCPRFTDDRRYRCADWPVGVLAVGEIGEPMPADDADIAALRFAVALWEGKATNDDERRGHWVTGRAAYAFWADLLRNEDEPVVDRHHANVKGRLIENRTAAAAYLRDVAARYDGNTAEALNAAAKQYDAVVAAAKTFKHRGLSKGMEHRRAMADLIDRIADAEAKAIQHLQGAI